MKMEILVTSEASGTIVELHVNEGDSIEDGEIVAITET